MTYGLQATATPASTNVTGTQTVGITPTVSSITATTYCCFSWKAISATTANSVVFNLKDGTVAALDGTPVVSDGDGRDCEGVSLTPLTSCAAILIRVPSTNTGTVTTRTTGNLFPEAAFPAGVVSMLGNMSTALTLDVTTMNFVLENAADTVEVVAIYTA